MNANQNEAIIVVKPGDNVQKLVNRAPSGATFIFTSGTHRFPQVQPKNENSFLSTEKAVLSGAEELDGFKEHDGRWAIDWHQRGTFHGVCAQKADKSEMTRCQYSQDLFMDDIPLKHVSSITDLKSGAWYFDGDHEQIYIADNPVDHKVEISVTSFAFAGSARDVTIQGLVIEKFANPAQQGVIHNYKVKALQLEKVGS